LSCGKLEVKDFLGGSLKKIIFTAKNDEN